eukprot:6757203-Pyramimonas_sp.AAC.2
MEAGRVTCRCYYKYSARTDGIVADSDSVYVLAYSIIMLNTDQHNKQVNIFHFKSNLSGVLSAPLPLLAQEDP